MWEKHAIQIMTWMLSKQTFFDEKTPAKQKEQNKWILVGNFAHMWRSLRLFYKFIKNNMKCGLSKSVGYLTITLLHISSFPTQ